MLDLERQRKIACLVSLPLDEGDKPSNLLEKTLVKLRKASYNVHTLVPYFGRKISVRKMFKL
jgi:hypothetical protein